MLKKSFIFLFIFIFCGNSETVETISNTQITNGDLNSASSNSAIDTTTTTLFTQFPVSSILKLSPTGDITTTTFPPPIIGETTTTTVPQTTTTTTTTVPQTTTTTTTTIPQTITTIGVTVANNGLGSNVYFLNGNQDATINLTTGSKYRFDLSDSSNSGHPLRFSTTQNGSEYSSNVTTIGTAGTVGAYVEIEITSNTPSQLYIYCTNHFGMGGNTVILTP
tara:strand:+ start:340 stop:1002 length:663 start_codon:yes stop_codon:yes gene_type:complete